MFLDDPPPHHINFVSYITLASSNRAMAFVKMTEVMESLVVVDVAESTTWDWV